MQISSISSNQAQNKVNFSGNLIVRNANGDTEEISPLYVKKIGQRDKIPFLTYYLPGVYSYQKVYKFPNTDLKTVLAAYTSAYTSAFKSDEFSADIDLSE